VKLEKTETRKNRKQLQISVKSVWLNLLDFLLWTLPCLVIYKWFIFQCY